MNELNYASLEASKKLVDNGIVLETDFYWRVWTERDKFKSGTEIVTTEVMLALMNNDNFYENDVPGVVYYPAPCFTEVWRELPATIEIDGETYNLCCHKIGGVNCAEYVSDLPETVGSVYGVNMADNLIELLVWVKGAGK
jgi:hypothetical protein